MARTTNWITYSKCGHEAKTMVNHHNAKERTRKVEWMAENLECPDCVQAWQDARIADVAAKSDMEGTPKQVEWAERIRAEKLAEVDKDFANDDKGSEMVVAIFAIRDIVAGVKSAAWWIDNRNDRLTRRMGASFRELGFASPVGNEAAIAAHVIGDAR